jgi:hypothetical protein
MYHFRYSPWTPWDVILEGRDWPADLLRRHDDDDDDDDDGEVEFCKVLKFIQAQNFILHSARNVNQMVAM